jgi:hypothetical protein
VVGVGCVQARVVSSVLLFEHRACGGERIELIDHDNDLCPLVRSPTCPCFRLPGHAPPPSPFSAPAPALHSNGRDWLLYGGSAEVPHGRRRQGARAERGRAGRYQGAIFRRVRRAKCRHGGPAHPPMPQLPIKHPIPDTHPYHTQRLVCQPPKLTMMRLRRTSQEFDRRAEATTECVDLGWTYKASHVRIIRA